MTDDLAEAMKELQKVIEDGKPYFASKELTKGYINRFLRPTLHRALTILAKELDNICKEVEEENHRLTDDEVQSVIHYTSISALFSMLYSNFKNRKDYLENDSSPENACLRLYDSAHFNDPDEGKFLHRQLDQYDFLQKAEAHHAYVASFITPKEDKGRDNLVFWRMYGDEGEGCSLLIPAGDLTAGDKLSIFKVLYGEDNASDSLDKIKATLEKIIPVIPALKSLEEPFNRDILHQVATAVLEPMERIRYLYKSEAYDYEQECRIVLHDSDLNGKPNLTPRYEYQDHYNSPGQLRSFCEHPGLEISKLLVSGSIITLGPCVPYVDHVERTIKKLLKAAGLHGPQVKRSEIIYRKN